MRFEIDIAHDENEKIVFDNMLVVKFTENGPAGGNPCYILDGSEESFYEWCIDTGYYDPEEFDKEEIISIHKI